MGNCTQSNLPLTQANLVSSPNGLNKNKRHVVDLSLALDRCLDAQKRRLDLSSALFCLFLASLPLVLGEARPVERDSSRWRG